ncbi:hypothetical protein MTO96_019221 [Rhipicephalus appendiculatus]
MNPFVPSTHCRRSSRRTCPPDGCRQRHPPTTILLFPVEVHPPIYRVRRRSSSVPPPVPVTVVRANCWSYERVVTGAHQLRSAHACGVIFGVRPLRSVLKAPDSQRPKSGGDRKKVVTFNNTTIVYA